MQESFRIHLPFPIVHVLVVLLTAAFSCAALADSPDNEPKPSWLGPMSMSFLDDDTLLIMQQDARRLDWFSLTEKKVLDSVTLPDEPHFMLVDSKNPSTAFVSAGRVNGAVYEIDLNSKKIVRTWGGIHSPWALAKTAQKLYVGRRFHNDVLIIDLNSGNVEEKTIPVVREPTTMVLSPDEKTLYVGNALTAGPANSVNVATSISQISLVDKREAARASGRGYASEQAGFEDTHVQSGTDLVGSVKEIPLVDGSNVIRGMAISQDGQWLLAVHNLSSHRTITTQLAGGWTSQNGLTIYNVTTGGAAATYLIDDSYLGAPNPWSVQFSPDGKLLAITVAGGREIQFFSVEALFKQVNRDTRNMSLLLPIYYDVGSFFNSAKRIRVPELVGPRALAMNDKYTVAAGYFSDNLAVFDRVNTPADDGDYKFPAKQFTSFQPRIVPLGPAPVLNAVRRGEILFHDGEASSESWHSCATCHPDARVDGMNWDLLNDGTGNHKSTKSMVLAHKTPPCMALGVRANAEAAVAAGFVHIHFMPRQQSDYNDVDEYLKALVPVPGPAIQPDGTLSESAKRGKRLFHSPKTGCASCHSGPYLTDLKMHDVGTEAHNDFGESEFDTPSLIEVHRTGPYLHDGRYTTLEDLLFKGLHGDLKGERLNQLTDQEKADLINYLLSL
ncbi:MAG: c-type cytochrome [Thermoguttaceae bacterium]|nr:c-type cytochrome [Thermoguttaceae bacterium]